MPDLKLNDFNKRLSRLKELEEVKEIKEEHEKDKEEDTSKDLESREEFLVMKWKVKLTENNIIINDLPHSYFYVLCQFESGDLVLFMSGIIHTVIGGTNKEVVRIKVSSELCQFSTRKEDIS